MVLSKGPGIEESAEGSRQTSPAFGGRDRRQWSQSRLLGRIRALLTPKQPRRVSWLACQAWLLAGSIGFDSISRWARFVNGGPVAAFLQGACDEFNQLQLAGFGVLLPGSAGRALDAMAMTSAVESWHVLDLTAQAAISSGRGPVRSRGEGQSRKKGGTRLSGLHFNGRSGGQAAAA